MIIHFSPAFDEGVYPLPEERLLSPNERFVGELGLLMLLERDLGLIGEYPDNEERALLYKNALKKYLDGNVEAFFHKSFLQDEIAVAEQLLSWRDELVMAGFKNIQGSLPARAGVLAEVDRIFEKHGFQSYGVADRWQSVLETLPKAELSVSRMVIHEKREFLHPFFIHLLDELSKVASVEESLFDVRPEGRNNLQKLQKALLNGERNVELAPVKEDSSFLILKVKDNYVAGDFIADQIRNGYRPLFLNTEDAVFDSCLVAAGLPASGSVNYASTPQILQLFKLIATGLFAPLNVQNLLSLLQAPYLPFSSSLAFRLARQLAETPGINNENWKEVIEAHINGGNSQKRRAELETFLSFHEADKNAVINIKKRYGALKKWVDQYPYLDKNEVKEEEKDQFIYLGQLCRDLLTELNGIDEEEEISEDRFLRMLESIYKPGSFRYFRKQKDSPLIFRSPGVITEQPSKVCWMNWQDGRQSSHPLSFLNKEERDFLIENGGMIYSQEKLDQLRYLGLLKGIIAASEQLVLVIPEVVGGGAAWPNALTGDIGAVIKNLELVSLNQEQIRDWSRYLAGQSNLSEKEEVPLPLEVDYMHDLVSIKEHHTRGRESFSSIEELIQNPFDWVVGHLANISGTGTISLPDLFRQKGLVTHDAVEQIMKAIKENPEAVFDDEKVTGILYQSIEQSGLELFLPENQFERHELEMQFKKSVQALIGIIHENNLKIEDAEVSKIGTIDELGDFSGFLDLLLSDEEGNPVIFDLKWTFKSKKYASKIAEEKDLQLILYRELMRQESDRAIKTGYFLLNDGNLYTRYDFHGHSVVKLDAKSTEEEMLQRIVNSVKYRRAEFANGIVEVGEESSITQLSYCNDSEEMDLVPIETDSSNKNKRMNYYSSLSLFKGKIH